MIVCFNFASRANASQQMKVMNFLLMFTIGLDTLEMQSRTEDLWKNTLM